jgi:hypothetical protein
MENEVKNGTPISNVVETVQRITKEVFEGGQPPLLPKPDQAMAVEVDSED